MAKAGTKASTKAEAGKERPAIQTLPVVSFDLGNRVHAITDGEKLVSFPSYSMPVSARQDWDFSLPAFQEGESFRVDIPMDEDYVATYAVGKVAQSLSAHATFAGDKWAKVKENLFAALTAVGVNRQCEIRELRCMVPDDQDPHQVAPFKALQNKTFEFRVNSKEYSVKIGTVRIMAEGRPAWLRAKAEGRFLRPDLSNCVLDLGGGTAIFRVITPDGMIDRSRERVLKGGTSSLAAMIASEAGLEENEGGILDAIADGTFMVGVSNIRGPYQVCLPQWVDRIRGQVRNVTQPINSQYGQILLIGGSVPLYAPVVDGNKRYVIAPDPQFYSLWGLQGRVDKRDQGGE